MSVHLILRRGFMSGKGGVLKTGKAAHKCTCGGGQSRREPPVKRALSSRNKQTEAGDK